MPRTTFLESAEDIRVIPTADTRRFESSTGRRLLRVLYAVDLDPSRKFGSLEEQVFILAQAFRDRGGLFAPLFSSAADPGTRKRYSDAGLEANFLDLGRFRPSTLARLVHLIHRLEIQVIHWNFFPPLTNPYLWCLSVLTPRVRHFFTDHSSRTALAAPPSGRLRSRLRCLLRRQLLKRYRTVVGVSEYVVGCLRQQGVWPTPNCLIHFINTDRFAPDPGARVKMRERLGDEGHFVLVVVGQLIAAKGIDVAIRAVAETPEHVRLWVIGDGVESGTLQTLARDLGLQERVRFLGLQSLVQPYLQAADAFVCPSRWAEAAGLVNLEAQATGLPALASDTGGIPEYIADGKSGFLFPVGDHARLADHVRRLAVDPDLCRKMGQAARELAQRSFSVEARLADYLALYEPPPIAPLPSMARERAG